MIIECPTCEGKVDAKILAEHTFVDREEGEQCKYSFLACPVCTSPIVAASDLVQVSASDLGWGRPCRSWPDPERYYDFNIPSLVRKSLEEARKCYGAKAYSACAVMCGRAIEAICKEKVKAKTLADGLKKLKDATIIDSRLYQWGDALRKERNMGAHASDDFTTKDDAHDLLDFASAISEYVYVLSQKYDEYLARKERRVSPVGHN